MTLSENNPQVFIIFGPPGSGKGTQAKLLVEKFNFYHWDTSQIIGRVLAEGKKDEFIKIGKKLFSFAEQRKKRLKGLLWDSDFILYFAVTKIKKLAKEKTGIVMTGSPRTIYEAEKLIPLLQKLYGQRNVIVIVLELSAKESIWRNSHRRECELIRHPILYSPETAKLKKCPLDGSRLIFRRDDTLSVIKTRLKEYAQKSFPLIGYLAKQNLTVKEINGEQSVADVFEDILRALK